MAQAIAENMDERPGVGDILLEPTLWKKEQEADEDIMKIRKLLDDNKIPWISQRYILKDDGLLYFVDAEGRERIEVPLKLRTHVLKLCHDNMAHLGRLKTISALIRSAHWKGMHEDTRSYIGRCVNCKRRKVPKPARAGMSQRLYRLKPGELYCVDFLCKQLPKTVEGYHHALVVMDVFTRYPWVVPLRNKEPKHIADRLFELVFSHVGLPVQFHSDNDYSLCSRVLQLLFERWGVKKTTISARHPTGNSVAERFMRYLNAALTTTLIDFREWPTTLAIVLFAYRNVHHTVSGYSPAFVTYGRHPQLPIQASLEAHRRLTLTGPQPQEASDYVNKVTERLVESFERIRRLQNQISLRNQEIKNENRYEVEYQVGDSVLFWDPESTQAIADDKRPLPLPGDEEIENIPATWKYRWSGPHIIVHKIGERAYGMFHSVRRKIIQVPVDSLQLVDPTSDYIVSDKLPKPKIPQLLPPDKGTKPVLHQGDLCALRLDIKEEPLVIARYLGPVDDTNGELEFQWCGSEIEGIYSDPEQRLCKMSWMNGWYQPRDARFYWKDKKQHLSHIPFTNLHSGHVVTMENILHSGFGLLTKCKVPTAEAKKIIQAWRKSLPRSPSILISGAPAEPTNTPSESAAVSRKRKAPLEDQERKKVKGAATE